jgi:hypothetical protein
LKPTLIVLAILACSLAAPAEPLKGIVQNLTTKKPSAGDEVMLKRIGNGMEDVAKTKTNSKGEFTFNAPPTQQPYIIWIEHQGVTYTQRAMPGGNVVVARVYDAGPNVPGVTILQHALLFHTGEQANALVGEEVFTLGNSSQPPRTMMKEHTLEFSLPEGANISEASVKTGGGVDLKTAVIPQGEKNKYAFKFPIRPGETQFHIAYTLPYSGKLTINPKLDLQVDSLMVAAPQAMKVSPAAQNVYTANNNPQFQGVNFYIAKNVTPQQQVAFEISGAGEMPRESEPAAADPNGGGRGRQGPGGGMAPPNEMPDPLHSGQWLFLGVLSLFLAAGAVFVFTSNQKLAPAVAGGGKKSRDRTSTLMDAMKEEVFQLESDRLQGKISPEEYQTAKAALDKTLQRAVQRQATKGK